MEKEKKNETNFKWNVIEKDGNPKKIGEYLATTETRHPTPVEGEIFIARMVQILDFKKEYLDDNENYKILKKPEWIYQRGFISEGICKDYGIDVVAWAEFPKPYEEDTENK